MNEAILDALVCDASARQLIADDPRFEAGLRATYERIKDQEPKEGTTYADDGALIYREYVAVGDMTVWFILRPDSDRFEPHRIVAGRY